MFFPELLVVFVIIVVLASTRMQKMSDIESNYYKKITSSMIALAIIYVPVLLVKFFCFITQNADTAVWCRRVSVICIPILCIYLLVCNFLLPLICSKFQYSVRLFKRRCTGIQVNPRNYKLEVITYCLCVCFGLFSPTQSQTVTIDCSAADLRTDPDLPSDQLPSC